MSRRAIRTGTTRRHDRQARGSRGAILSPQLEPTPRRSYVLSIRTWEYSMPVIQVTNPAAERIRELLGKEGKGETHGLRMRVVGGGCSGLRYELAFDDQIRDVDTQIEVNGVRVILDEKSALYLAGTTLDFVDTLQESGFKMNNPNASSTCGCGESFSA